MAAVVISCHRASEGPGENLHRRSSLEPSRSAPAALLRSALQLGRAIRTIRWRQQKLAGFMQRTSACRDRT